MARSALDEVTDTGAFDRLPSTFRSSVSRDASARFPAVPGRYHLYVSYACPWASRCLAFLKLKGLDKAIGFSVSHHTLERPLISRLVRAQRDRLISVFCLGIIAVCEAHL
jgi:glutathionyl-hydroquinone reductase